MFVSDDLTSYSTEHYETYSTWSDRIANEYREKVSRKAHSENNKIQWKHQKPKPESRHDFSNKSKLSQSYVTKAKLNSTLKMQKLFMKYQQRLKIMEMREKITENGEKSGFDKIPFPGGSEADLDFQIIKSYVESKGDDKESVLKILKRERIRWHPDKLKQKFETLLLEDLTSELILKRAIELFQNIDSLYKIYLER